MPWHRECTYDKQADILRIINTDHQIKIEGTREKKNCFQENNKIDEVDKKTLTCSSLTSGHPSHE